MTDNLTLDTLDDATLRSIAYGRADSDTERMRAQRAARILADRGDHERGADAPTSEAAPAPEPITRASNADSVEGEEPAVGRSSSRAVGAALLIGGLVVGLAAGIGGERLVNGTAPESLAVFDREATDDDYFATEAALGGSFSDTRLIGTVDDVRVYAVRVPAEALFGSTSLGPQICVAAAEDIVQYPLPVCVAESGFAVTGLTGVIGGINLESLPNENGERPNERAISIEWGPRGEPRLSDITDDVRASIVNRFSDDERAVGEDLLLTQGLRELPPDPRMAERLRNDGIVPTVGPAIIADLSTPGLGRIVVFGTIAAEPSQATAVCLTVIRSEIGWRDSECTDLDSFRSRGFRMPIEHDGGLTTVVLNPGAGTSIELLEISQ